VLRELFTAFFEQLRADAESQAPDRLLDVGDGEALEDPVFLPAPSASPLKCEALGRVLLKMLLLGLPCPLRLSPSLVKALACSEEDLTLHDLLPFDRHVASTLRYITSATSDELEGMALSFAESEDPQRVGEPVNAANVREFVQARVLYILEKSRLVQVERLVYGFRAIPPLDAHLDLLGFRGVSDLLFDSATRVIDPSRVIADLEWQGWAEGSSVPAYLSDFLRDLDQERLRRFLRLATGQCVLPSAGFSPPISIQRCAESAALPVGSTCFHIVRLPEYSSREQLEGKMKMALDHVGAQDFGFV
jgi:hypothetical protein